jgi:hypothetical protein
MRANAYARSGNRLERAVKRRATAPLRSRLRKQRQPIASNFNSFANGTVTSADMSVYKTINSALALSEA